MQIVPYMPIHPAQLSIHHEEEEEKHPDSSLPIPVDPKSDDDLFKKPFPPTPYFVEEPPENLVKRTTRMKRFDLSLTFRQNSEFLFDYIEVILNPFVRIIISPSRKYAMILPPFSHLRIISYSNPLLRCKSTTHELCFFSSHTSDSISLLTSDNIV